MLQRFERMHQQDLYQVLDTPSTASADDIRRSYYTLAKRFHPDKFTREEMKTKAEKVFGHITEAYSTLSREASRKKYDEDLAARQRPRTQERVDSGDIARQNYRHGRELLDRGRFGEAVSFLQNAVEQDPSKAEYVFQLALAQSKNPRWKKEAEENFLSALRIDPTNAEFYAQLGALYARGGVHSKAREMFRKALEWDPDNAVAREGLDPGGGDKKGLLGMFKK
jgi:curved DNA-binding protein CbpA